MNYFQPNLVDTIYSAGKELMVENHYKNPNGFKRLGNETLCGTTFNANDEISIREKFEKTGALNPPVDTDIYIKNSFGNDIQLPNHKCIVDSKTGKPLSVMSKTYATQDNEPIYEVFERNKDILDLETNQVPNLETEFLRHKQFHKQVVGKCLIYDKSPICR